jgi:hypothetical protein
MTPWCCKLISELLMKCNVWCVYVDWCDLGFNRVGLKSVVISIDYRDYMGSSSKIWAFWSLFLYLCSYNLDGSVTSSIRGTPPMLHHMRPFHVGLSNGHDLLTLDSWAHCHPLGGHQPTLQPPLDQIFTCARLGTAIGSQLRPYDAKAVH